MIQRSTESGSLQGESAPQQSAARWGAVVLLLLVLPLVLSGCIMQRIYSFKNQLCDYEANFRLTHEDGVTLSMLRPVIGVK